MSEARLILTCGLPGAGKTTLATELAADRSAVRLTKDEWLWPWAALPGTSRPGRRSNRNEDRNDYNTEFGPANVLLHTVSVDVDLGDAGEALDVAARVDPSGPSPGRQARFYIDVARAHAQRRRVGEATAALVKADRLAPEHTRTHQAARQCLDDLLAQAGRRPPVDLTDLA